MKKNKGFTLVELLAVIVILALLLTIAVPNVIALSKRIRRNMFCTKVENLESAAKLYANDYMENDGKTIDVGTLIENNFLKKEDADCDLRNEKGKNKPCVKDPRNNAMMDKDKIILEKKDKKVVATYQYNSNSGEDNDKDYCKNR